MNFCYSENLCHFLHFLEKKEIIRKKNAWTDFDIWGVILTQILSSLYLVLRYVFSLSPLSRKRRKCGWIIWPSCLIVSQDVDKKKQFKTHRRGKVLNLILLIIRKWWKRLQVMEAFVIDKLCIEIHLTYQLSAKYSVVLRRSHHVTQATNRYADTLLLLRRHGVLRRTRSNFLNL